MPKIAPKRPVSIRARRSDDVARAARGLAERVFEADQLQGQIQAVERAIGELYLKADDLRRRDWGRFVAMTSLSAAHIRAKRNSSILSDFRREAMRIGIVSILAERYGVSLSTVSTVVRLHRGHR